MLRIRTKRRWQRFRKENKNVSMFWEMDIYRGVFVFPPVEACLTDSVCYYIFADCGSDKMADDCKNLKYI